MLAFWFWTLAEEKPVKNLISYNDQYESTWKIPESLTLWWSLNSLKRILSATSRKACLYQTFIMNLWLFINTPIYHSLVFCSIISPPTCFLVFFACTLCFPPCGWLLCDIPFVGSAPLNSIFSLPPAVWLVFAQCKFAERICGAAFHQCSTEKQKQLL